MAKQHQKQDVTHQDLQTIVEALSYLRDEFQVILDGMDENGKIADVKSVPTLESGINGVLTGLKRAKEAVNDSAEQTFKIGRPLLDNDKADAIAAEIKSKYETKASKKQATRKKRAR